MTSPTDHARFLQQLDAYVAGGLSDAEREAAEAHAATCAACAAALHDARAADAAMADLFAAARPDAGFEDRLVGRLRAEATRPKRRQRTLAFPRLPTVHPFVRRAAVGAAAVLVLGGVGYVAQQSLQSGRGLPTPWATNVQVDGQQAPPSGATWFDGSPRRLSFASNLRQMGEAIRLYQQPTDVMRHLEEKRAAQGGKDAPVRQELPKADFDGSEAALNLSYYAKQTPEQMARESAEAARAKLSVITQNGGETYNWRFTQSNGRREPAAAAGAMGDTVALDAAAATTNAPAAAQPPPPVASTPASASLATSANGSAPGGQPGGFGGFGGGTGPQGAGFGASTAGGDRFGVPAGGGGAAGADQALAKGSKERAPEKPAEVRAFKPGTAFADDYAEATQSPASDAPRAGKFGEAKQLAGIQDKLGANPAQPKDQNDSILMPTEDADALATARLAEVEKKANQDRSRQLAEEGQQAQRDGRDELASQLYSQAVALDPNNQNALEGRAAARQRLGPDEGSSSDGKDRTATLIQARNQLIESNFNDAARAAQDAIARNDFQTARIALDRARVARGQDPNLFSNERLQVFDKQIQDAQLQLERGEAKHTEQASSGEQTAARRNVEAARESAQRERAQTVEELTRTAERLKAEGHIEQAMGVVDQIKVLDPTNEYAQKEKGDGPRSGHPIQDSIAQVPDFDDAPQFNLDQSPSGKAPQAAPSSSPQPATQPATGGGASGPTTPATPTAAAQRRIIRNGEMTFEVDGFDSALLQVTKIADEEGGFVATTTSEKLPNGKVKGAVVVRVPPERLDTLVLKLRGLGDLKASRIGAQDVTKQYTDIESQLKAGRAMEARLLDIIRTGKGEIKDLIEAEKQLGVWREKIEMLEGEIRYYNNLISLSTLTVNLVEREIRNAAMVSESEQVNMGLEADDVEQARAAALKAVEDAKGRIVASELKKLPAGQYLAQVVAEVKPDAAGPLTDRLKQIGRVARLEVERKQASPEGTTVPTSGVRVERRDTRFVVSLYNLANVDPRTSTTLNLAAADVEVAYRAILDQVKSAGGRVVTSQLNRAGPTQTTGTLTFQVPAEQADVVLGALRSAGEVMKLDVTQNPDTQNTTETKRGFVVQVFALATVPAKETTELQIAATKVPASFTALREAVRSAGGRILTSQLSAQDANNSSGQLVFEVPREQWGAVDQALAAAGEVVSRSVNRAAEGENAVDTKVRLSVTLVDEARLNPRQTVEMRLAVRDVAAAYGKLLESLRTGGARVLTSQLSDPQNQQNVTGTLVFDVRGEPARAALEKAIDDAGDVYGRTVNRSSDGANVIEDKTRLSVTLIAADRLPPRQTTTMGLEVEDVERAKGSLEATAIALGGTVNSTISRERTGATISQLTIQVPLSKQPEMLKTARDQGKVLVVRDESDPNVPAGDLTRAKLSVTLATPDQIQPAGTTLGSSIRGGLRYSLQGLLWSLQWVIVGLCFVLPWVLLVWAIARVVRRSRKARGARDTIIAPPPTMGPGAPATA